MHDQLFHRQCLRFLKRFIDLPFPVWQHAGWLTFLFFTFCQPYSSRTSAARVRMMAPVPQKSVRSLAHSGKNAARNGKDITAFLQGKIRCNQCPAPGSRLDDDDTAGHAGNDTVAGRKITGQRLHAKGKFTDDGTAGITDFSNRRRFSGGYVLSRPLATTAIVRPPPQSAPVWARVSMPPGAAADNKNTLPG